MPGERIKSLECFCSNKLVWYQLLTSTLIEHELAPCKRAGCARSGLIAIQHNINEKSFTPFGIAIFHFRPCTLAAHTETANPIPTCTRNANSIKTPRPSWFAMSDTQVVHSSDAIMAAKKKLHCHVRVHQLLRDSSNNINSTSGRLATITIPLNGQTNDMEQTAEITDRIFITFSLVSFLFCSVSTMSWHAHTHTRAQILIVTR